MWVLLIFTSAAVVVLTQHQHGHHNTACKTLKDCTSAAPETLCDNHGQVYSTRCDLENAECQWHGVREHPCPTTTTAATTVTTKSAQELLDLLCLQLAHEDCPTRQAHICASNGKIYDNLCEFEKARCTHRTLALVSCIGFTG